MIDKDEYNIDELGDIVETIIYENSQMPKDYINYLSLIIDNISKLCNLITSKKSFIPQITEYIIKEGDTNLINIERVNNIILTKDVNLSLYQDYLSKVRNQELKCYHAALIIQQNYKPATWRQKLIRLINKQILVNKQKSKDLLFEIAENTYIPPTITNIIPKIRTQNGFYTPKYWIIEANKYIYGGNFPSFKSSIDGSNNYTDDDIYNLALTLNIDYQEDIEIKDLYDICIKQLELYSSDKVQIYPKTGMINYNPTLIPSQKILSYVNYIYRPRLGVKTPSEVYAVYPDTYSAQYIVPFKFSDSGIPVYNQKFLDPEISKYYYYEGPAIFEESSDRNHFIFSNFYILVEYKDNFGKLKQFREGVNPKFIEITCKNF